MLTDDRFQSAASGGLKSTFRGVGPLLTSSWRQGAPYNDFCPIGFYDGPCVVGCAATGAAQIINYHQWPPRGTGTHAYLWSGDGSCGAGSTPPRTLIADYSDPYVYDESPGAVAELSYEVGVALNMVYSQCGSGADMLGGIHIFSDHFRYADGARVEFRPDYTVDDWFEIVKNEINEFRPILYRIYLHIIVCDGWQQISGINQYHCNYGWADGHNAWYTVDELYCGWDGCTPMAEYMLVNIAPEKNIPFLAETSLSDAILGDGDGVPEAGETIDLVATVANYSTQAWSDISAQLRIDDASIAILDGVTTYTFIGDQDSADNAADPFTISIPVNYDSRIDSFFLILTFDGGAAVDTLIFELPLGEVKTLLVDDDADQRYELFYRESLDHLRVPYDIWNSPSSDPPDSAFLARYDNVIWFTGEYGPNPLSSIDMARIRGYLDGGGNLALSGQGIALQLSGFNPTLLHTYLKSDYRSSYLVPLLAASSGCQAFSPGDTIDAFGEGGAYILTQPDHIVPMNGGVAELAYSDQSDYGAVSYAGTYKTVLLGFGLEGVDNSTLHGISRDTVLARILDFFDCRRPNGYPRVEHVGPNPGTPSNLVDHSPSFGWGYYDPQPLLQQGYQMQISSDSDWTMIDMWDTGPVMDDDTAVSYSGSGLVDGYTYYLRLRVSNGVLWSDWFQTEIHMNSIPATPAGESPIGMAGVASATPDLTAANATDAESDSLTYDFEVYGDSLMTVPIAAAEGIYQQADMTRWTLPVSLTDDQIYYWRVRADDGFEPGAWGPLAAFWVNTVNQTPTAFGLISPVDGSRLDNPQPAFAWNASHDGDPYDHISYSLHYSTDPLFLYFDSIIGAYDTFLTMAQSPDSSGQYFWKVKATDAFGAAVFSDKTYAFIIVGAGDANCDGTTNVGDAVFVINYLFKNGQAPGCDR